MTARLVEGDTDLAAPRTIAPPDGTTALRERHCRGCGVKIRHRRRWYCLTCEASRCPECRASPGRHKTSCRYTQRKRRPRLTIEHDRVTEDAVLDLYLAHGPAAVRLAARVLGKSEAQDVVHDVFVYVLEKRRYIRQVPGRAYLFTAVRHAAIRRFVRYWSRFGPTLAELHSAEQLLARDEPEAE
jgi:sigma-70-like protein